MAGIFPTLANGGLAVPNDALTNVYVPAAPFSFAGCPDGQTALPNTCSATLTFEQFNAVASELIALAEAMDPDGVWTCTNLNNLATAYNARSTVPTTLPVHADETAATTAGLASGELYKSADGILRVKL